MDRRHSGSSAGMEVAQGAVFRNRGMDESGQNMEMRQKKSF